MEKGIVVTGASSGIGKAAALQWIKKETSCMAWQSLLGWKLLSDRAFDRMFLRMIKTYGQS